MKIPRTALLLWLASATLASAAWQVASATRENSPNDIVEHRKVVVEEEPGGRRATLHFALFKTSAATLRIIDQPAAPRSDLAATMRRVQALAGVNGGYFDPQDAPVGLLVSGGKKKASLSKARLLSGVLFARAGRVEIVRAREFAPSAKIHDAVQCGPLLVDRGEAVAGLNATRPARRTFALTLGKGEAALGFCSSVSLAQLGAILAEPGVIGDGRAVARALNLDGGSSSAFWIGPGADAFSISEQKTVRDFVAIVPRPAR